MGMASWHSSSRGDTGFFILPGASNISNAETRYWMGGFTAIIALLLAIKRTGSQC